ncbi:MAG: GTPase Era [Actinobacteria bacterium]|nr:GTPase Era [Actinomycetota bacterium]
MLARRRCPSVAGDDGGPCRIRRRPRPRHGDRIDGSDDVTFRSGFACLVGRPNAGKSTLTNAMVGRKVAITSDRPQTTRRVLRGIVNRPDGQLIMVDTPGLHRPRTLLGERLNDQVRETWSSVDVVGLCIPANETVGPGDRFIATQLSFLRRKPIVAVVTKTDLVTNKVLAERLAQVSELADAVGIIWAEVVPVSARSGDHVALLTERLIAQMPEGPVLFPDGDASDEPVDMAVSELIREAALDGVQDELPHSIAVVVEEIVPREDRPVERPLTDVRATLYVERDSQKAIVIGKAGSRLKQVGTRARAEIEALLGVPVYLDIRVKVAKDWQKDPKQLRRLGF